MFNKTFSFLKDSIKKFLLQEKKSCPMNKILVARINSFRKKKYYWLYFKSYYSLIKNDFLWVLR